MDRRTALKTALAATAASSVAAPVLAGSLPPGAVALVITLRVKPEHRQEFLALLTPLLDAMRHEPTFIDTVLHEDPEDPAGFMLYEIWADMEDLVEVQAKRPYREPFMARLPELLRAPRELQVWRPVRRDRATG
jgi:quinol monooxygenase YgiN